MSKCKYKQEQSSLYNIFPWLMEKIQKYTYVIVLWVICGLQDAVFRVADTQPVSLKKVVSPVEKIIKTTISKIHNAG